jgi:hypothetical protein
MTAPAFYLVADGFAYAIEEDGYMFGAPVDDDDGSVIWDCAYDFNPCDEDVEYVAHMCQLLQHAQSLTIEQTNEVFVK